MRKSSPLFVVVLILILIQTFSCSPLYFVVLEDYKTKSEKEAVLQKRMIDFQLMHNETDISGLDKIISDDAVLLAGRGRIKMNKSEWFANLKKFNGFKFKLVDPKFEISGDELHVVATQFIRDYTLKFDFHFKKFSDGRYLISGLTY